MKSKCCAFTGHRPHKFPWKYDEANSRCVALKAKLTEQITKLAENGVTDFYSGGADGVDCCQRQFEIVRKRRRNFVVFRRGGGNRISYFLAGKEYLRFAVSGA